MDKIATLVKEAEVRGVLAGLVDGGHLKLASYEELDAFTEAVASMLPDNSYGLEDVLDKTAELIEYIESGDMEKGASDELDETALMAAFGELTMMKMAGQIDDETFEKEAADIRGMLTAGPGMVGKAWGGVKAFGGKAVGSAKSMAGKAWGGLSNAATGSQMRSGHNTVKGAKNYINGIKDLEGDALTAFEAATGQKRDAILAAYGNQLASGKRDRLIGAAKTLGLYGTGVTAAGVGGKALYDKYKK